MFLLRLLCLLRFSALRHRHNRLVDYISGKSKVITVKKSCSNVIFVVSSFVSVKFNLVVPGSLIVMAILALFLSPSQPPLKNGLRYSTSEKSPGNEFALILPHHLCNENRMLSLVL